MRIISPQFHDYYDKVQSFLPDNLNYIRQKEEVREQNLLFPIFYSYDAIHSVSVQQHIVGFCGKIYPVLRLSFHKYPKDYNISSYEVFAFCFNIQDIDDFVKNNFSRKAYEDYLKRTNYPRRNKRKHWRIDCKHWDYSLRREEFEDFFKKFKEIQNDFVEMFNKKQCPIFIVDVKPYYFSREKETLVTYNGCLRELEFYRMFDPYTAYQEIEMFLTNFAVPQKKMPIIENEAKIFTHGFNNFSFRKEKSKK